MERSIELSPVQKDLIEKFGVQMERSGYSPAESRIIGLLAVSDIHELTFDEIYGTLHISKGAASNVINRLLEIEHIEYITRPGDRRRYFRLAMNNHAWEKRTQEKLRTMADGALLWQEILNQRTSDTREFNKGLQRISRFMTFVQGELPALFEKWRRLNP